MMSRPKYVSKEHRYHTEKDINLFDEYLNNMADNGYRLIKFSIYNKYGEYKVFSLMELKERD